MNKYDILEQCLVEIEQGADMDTVLFRYPDLADELRPILETSIKAMDMAIAEPPLAMAHITRAKLLQHAAELREAKAKRSTRFWFASLRRMAVTFIVLLALFASGNGLVRASSNTIPGDKLYPVKRTWEDVLVLFTFNAQQRDELEIEHEYERLEELNELFAEGRSVKVDFTGYVTRLTSNEWRVSAISVFISPQTVLPNDTVTVGAAVRVVGVTQSDKTVLAERIELLPAGSKLPDVENNELDIQQENSNESDQSGEQESTSGSESEAPQIGETNTPEPGSIDMEPEDSGAESHVTATPSVSVPKATEAPQTNYGYKEASLEGTLQSMHGDIWTIGGRSVNVSSARISGTPVIGAKVHVEGYIDSSGAFVAQKVEIEKVSTDSNEVYNVESSSGDGTTGTDN